MEHSFDTTFAERHGIEESIIFCYLHYWCVQNKIKGVNQYEDFNKINRSWTFNSCKSFSKIFTYMSEAKIRRTLKNLEEMGFIIIGNFNKSAYDRTCWYAISELGEQEYIDCVTNYNFNLYAENENPSDKLNDSILQNCQMNLTESSNQSDESIKPIPFKNTFKDTLLNLNSHESKNICEESKKLCELLCNYCKRDNPRFSKKPEIIKKWTEDIGRTHFIDKYTWEEIEMCINFAKNDNFWNSNILSGDKLRKQMEKLYVKAKSGNKTSYYAAENVGKAESDRFSKSEIDEMNMPF